MNINDEKKLKELQALMAGMAESVLSASDEEILNEARDDGRDPDQDLIHTKSNLLSEMKELQLRRLREQHDLKVAAFTATKFEIPDTASKRRDLLAVIFARNDQFQKSIITAQHRDLKEMTDDDVESLLKQLASLGLLESPGS